MNRIKSLLLCGVLSCAMLMGSLPVAAESRIYEDKEQITATGIDLSTTKELTIAKPTKNVTTTASSYYITGTSDPEKWLTINGTTVERRGELGSYGMKVELAVGKNVFTVNNGGVTKSVTITREKAPDVSKTTKLTNAKPTANDYAFAGEYVLSCTAPSGATVSAKIAGQNVTLEQVAATAEEGVPAVFKATVELEAGEYSISYNLKYNGAVSTVNADGKLTVFEKGNPPTMEINQNSTTVYEKNDTASNFIAMLNQGARDEVLEFDGNLAKLSMGGWVKKEFLDIVDGDPEILNQVSGQTYEVTDSGEYLTLHGSIPSVFKSYMNSAKVYLRFYNMKGVTAIDVENSRLFEKAEVHSDGNSVTIEMLCREQGNVIGYDVRYNEDGSITVFFNEKPQIGSEEKPLENVTVIVDAGHGGMDPGALGVLEGKGPTEDDITMAHALAAQKRLESLGAKVILSVPQNLSQQKKVVLHERVEITREVEADFFISLHCNSIGGSANDLAAEGSEVYYYENISRQLSEDVVKAIAENCGRNYRGTYYSNYFVNRNTTCPGMLVEMGFVSNPKEYDNLRSGDSLFYTANAVADAILNFMETE